MTRDQSGQVTDFKTEAWTSLRKTITVCLCMILLGQLDATVASGQEPTPPPPRVQQVASPAPSYVPAQTPEAARQDPIPAAPIPQLSMLVQQSDPSQQTSTPQQPVGTAAAPYEKPTGVAGSRPAGAAIAPGKQRRVRAIVIKVSLILAGAGAVGAVVGLSRASHSEP